MTNVERCHRGFVDSNTCPFCLQQPETVIHVLRDCEAISVIWEKLIDEEELWYKFVSSDLDRWLQTNLGSVDYGKGIWHWPTLFGVMTSMIWHERNNLVFSGNRVADHEEEFLAKVLRQVDFVHNHLLNPSPMYKDC